jgi:hypothetical protein
MLPEGVTESYVEAVGWRGDEFVHVVARTGPPVRCPASLPAARQCRQRWKVAVFTPIVGAPREVLLAAVEWESDWSDSGEPERSTAEPLPDPAPRGDLPEPSYKDGWARCFEHPFSTLVFDLRIDGVSMPSANAVQLRRGRESKWELRGAQAPGESPLPVLLAGTVPLGQHPYGGVEDWIFELHRNGCVVAVTSGTLRSCAMRGCDDGEVAVQVLDLGPRVQVLAPAGVDSRPTVATLREHGLHHVTTGPAQQARPHTVVYTSERYSDVAASIADGLGVDTAALTWETPADIVVAVGLRPAP